MSYATAVITLSADPAPLEADGRAYLAATATVRGPEPVNLLVRAYENSAAHKALADKRSGDSVIASGEIALDQPDGDMPILTTAMLCNASEDQYLNEVVIVGRIGGDPKEADSGKSTRRSVAVNRYVRSVVEDEPPVEITDWYPVRAFGYVKKRLEEADKGALVEINGFFSQMTNAKGNPYCEVKARSFKLHRGSKGAGNVAAGTSAVGYDLETLQGSPDDMPTKW